MIDKESFLKQLKNLKKEYNIAPSPYATNETNRRRIAIIVTEAYLKSGGDFNKGIFLERELYDELKHEKLSCDPIYREIRSKELKHRDWNPLKITLSTSEKEERSSFVDQILYILSQTMEKEEAEHGIKNNAPRIRIRETGRPNIRRSISKVLRSDKADNCQMEIRRRSVLREDWD